MTTQLTDVARAFLEEPRFAVAATIASDGMPHQTVVWYMLDGDDVIINTPEGSLKHKHLLRDPRLSLCIEDGMRYVTVSGSVTLSPDPGRALYSQLGARYQASSMAIPSGPPPDPRILELLSRERITIRLKVERVIINIMG